MLEPWSTIFLCKYQLFLNYFSHLLKKSFVSVLSPKVYHLTPVLLGFAIFLFQQMISISDSLLEDSRKEKFIQTQINLAL